MVREHRISQRQACKAGNLPQSTLRCNHKPRNDDAVIQELQQLIEKHPSIGFWQCYYRIRRKGLLWNHKRIYRVYTALKLNIGRRLNYSSFIQYIEITN